MERWRQIELLFQAHVMLLWRTRMFARRGLSEAWLGLRELAKARSEANELTASVRGKPGFIHGRVRLGI